MDLPEKNESYKRKEYWDGRFSKEDNFEWCKSYVEFKDLIHEHVRKTDSILMLGCGNSMLSADMYKDGYRNIVNIDFSPVVIENMKRKCQALIGMQWMIMDITKMTFVPSSFDVIIEKATLDAFLVVEKDPWNPSQEAWNIMDYVLSQVFTDIPACGYLRRSLMPINSPLPHLPHHHQYSPIPNRHPPLPPSKKIDEFPLICRNICSKFIEILKLNGFLGSDKSKIVSCMERSKVPFICEI